MIDRNHWVAVIEKVGVSLAPIYRELPIEKAVQILDIEYEFVSALYSDASIFNTDDGFEQKLKTIFDEHFVYMGNWIDYVKAEDIAAVRKLLKAPNGS